MKKERKEEKAEKLEHLKKVKRTLLVTIFVCALVIIIITLIQLYGQNKIKLDCSYLDPPIIDYLAFLAAIFLVIEGFARIIEHPGASLRRQSTRIMRIALGCAITTLHVIQLIHK